MPCNAIRAEIPETVAAPDTAEAGARAAAAPAPSSWLKPSAAGFAPLLAAPVEEVDEVVLTFIGKRVS
jgi:hypothetical protein